MPPPDDDAGWAPGGTLLAATLMVVVGSGQALAGLATLTGGDLFTDTGDKVYRFSLTAWGWTHLMLGIATGTVGIFIFAGAARARVAGIVLAALSATESFLFLPRHPAWSLALLAMSILIIWSLATWRAPHRQ